jgi:hypothetical protein
MLEHRMAALGTAGCWRSGSIRSALVRGGLIWREGPFAPADEVTRRRTVEAMRSPNRTDARFAFGWAVTALRGDDHGPTALAWSA